MSLKPNILTVGKFGFYQVSDNGITFQPETPREEWLNVMKRLCSMHEGAAITKEKTLMLLADALNFGEKAFNEEFSQAIEGTREALGLTPKTLANAQWVYGKVDSSRRRDGLTLGHFSVLAALEPAEQDKYIEFALKDKMTVATLKECVAEAHPETKRGQKRKTTGGDNFQLKQGEVNEHLLGMDINELPEDWRPILEVAYKIYRRRWASGRKKK